MCTKLTLPCLAVAGVLIFSTWFGVQTGERGAMASEIAAVTTLAPTPITITAGAGHCTGQAPCAAAVLFLPVVLHTTAGGASTPAPTDATTATLTPTATYTPEPPPEIIDCDNPDWFTAPECLTPTATHTEAVTALPGDSSGAQAVSRAGGSLPTCAALDSAEHRSTIARRCDCWIDTFVRQ